MDVSNRIDDDVAAILQRIKYQCRGTIVVGLCLLIHRRDTVSGERRVGGFVYELVILLLLLLTRMVVFSALLSRSPMRDVFQYGRTHGGRGKRRRLVIKKKK